MTSIAFHAREYAAALDRLEAARAYMKSPPPHGERVTVSWLCGSATSGYRELAEMVSEQVSRQLPQLLADALAELESRVARAHGALNDAAFLGSKGRMRAGDLPDQGAAS